MTREVTGRVVIAIMFLAVVILLIPAEELLAPVLPEEPALIEQWILRELPPGETAGRPFRLITAGREGTPARPVTLDIPVEGSGAFGVRHYDWLRAVDRPVELRERGSFYLLLRVEREAQVLLVSPERIELLTGTVQWHSQEVETMAPTVFAGPIAITGRGHATISRSEEGVTIHVETGRFDLFQEGSPPTILGAGQRRQLDIPANEGARVHLQERLTELLPLLRAATVTGSELVPLWDATLAFAPRFAALEVRSDPSVRSPDLMMRDLREALRILGSYRFLPPEASGR